MMVPGVTGTFATGAKDRVSLNQKTVHAPKVRNAAKYPKIISSASLRMSLAKGCKSKPSRNTETGLINSLL